jgi:hypothetical protein
MASLAPFIDDLGPHDVHKHGFNRGRLKDFQ